MKLEDDIEKETPLLQDHEERNEVRRKERRQHVLSWLPAKNTELLLLSVMLITNLTALNSLT